MKGILSKDEQNTIAPSLTLGSNRRVLGMQRPPSGYYHTVNEDPFYFPTPKGYYVGKGRMHASAGLSSFYNDKHHYNCGTVNLFQDYW